jgi:hypothetical protein
MIVFRAAEDWLGFVSEGVQVVVRQSVLGTYSDVDQGDDDED